MAQSNVVRLPQINTLGGDMEAAIVAFLNYCKGKNTAPRTVEYYQTRLAAFTRWADDKHPDISPNAVTPTIVREFIAAETKRSSQSLGQHAYTALKAFFTFLHGEGYVEVHPLAGMEKPKAPRKVIATFSIEQIDRIINGCDAKTFNGCRDRAILFLLLDCGLRASELCGLDADDVDWTSQTVLVRLAKGGKERMVPFGNATRQALASYRSRRGDLESPSLFVTCYGQRFDRFRLLDIIRTRCENAGITGVRCSPHTLRHSMAVSYLRNGGDVFSLQKLLGHSDLTMTRRYAELSQTDVQNKHRLYSPADRLQLAKQSTGRRRLK